VVTSPTVAVIGLGYVGLPLAIALAEHGSTIGVDIDAERIAQLRAGHDRTREVEPERLAASSLRVTAEPGEARDAKIFIVTVPTPVDGSNRPDLGPLMSATRTVAGLLDANGGAIVVYESTVYPGVTEDICGPELERLSGLKRGRDFFLGYSPERINPGDREHRIEVITKVVAGEDPATLETLSALYGAVTNGNIFCAASIKAAEAAKVIENAQRDINIAFMNEIAQIFGKMDLSIWDVLDAARTKWNFLPFEPGLVGGHCIGVDPYYLAYLAEQLGHEPKVILAGRSINDGMGAWIADRLHERVNAKASKVLVLGLTFKENVPDLRNSRVIDIVERLRWLGHEVAVSDPLADPAEARDEYGLDLVEPCGVYDAVIGAVAHNSHRAMTAEEMASIVRPGGIVADLKRLWNWSDRPLPFTKWSL
jgi:UDP-N-acetyl-D-glucosamine/UDP-N-acetyl-D-galactosamine dehydrogenase